MIRGAWAIAALWLPLSGGEPENRAVAYLTREVPAWHDANQCFSCHNNGDAARALLVASRVGFSISDAALSGTLRWLNEPSRWDDTRGDPQFSDKDLARLQFAAALAEATSNGAALREAAGIVVSLQKADGSWPVKGEESSSSPVTWGNSLATVMARGVLLVADPVKYRDAIRKADKWLTALALHSTVDAAAILLSTPKRREESAQFLAGSQTSDGGWGPQKNAPAEAFDTAMAVIGLSRAEGGEALATAGREWLRKNQLPTGAWPGTTRPSGGNSYAQQVSTSAWATIALIQRTAKVKR